MSSSTVPLISDNDVELGEPPSYNKTVNSNKSSTNNKKNYKFHSFFLQDDVSIDSTSIAFASVSIRLGLFFNFKH